MSTRTVYLMDEINSTVAGQIIAWLLALDQESHDPIRLFVKSIGGEWDEGRRVCDTIIHQIKSPVITIAAHHADSAATAIVSSGVIRLAFSQTTFMYHKIGKSIESDEINDKWEEEEFSEFEKIYSQANEEYLSYCTLRRSSHIVKCTLKPRSLRSRIKNAKKNEYSIEAREAKRLGLIDAVIRNVDDIVRYEAKLAKPIEK